MSCRVRDSAARRPREGTSRAGLQLSETLTEDRHLRPTGIETTTAVSLHNDSTEARRLVERLGVAASDLRLGAGHHQREAMIEKVVTEQDHIRGLGRGHRGETGGALHTRRVQDRHPGHRQDEVEKEDQETARLDVVLAAAEGEGAALAMIATAVEAAGEVRAEIAVVAGVDKSSLIGSHVISEFSSRALPTQLAFVARCITTVGNQSATMNAITFEMP